MQPALDVAAPQHLTIARSAPVPERLTLQRCKSLGAQKASTCRCGAANHSAPRKPALDLSALQISSRRLLMLPIYSLALFDFAVLCLALGQWASQ